jgi:hypothetical protein
MVTEKLLHQGYRLIKSLTTFTKSYYRYKKGFSPPCFLWRRN